MTTDERPVSFEQFVTVRWAALYRTAYLLTRHGAGAEDLVQAALVKAYAAWGRVLRADSPEAYVRRMLINEFLSGRRRRQLERDRRHLIATDSASPEPTHETAVLDRVGLCAHVCALPPRQRAVVVLRYYEDYSERQIADVLGCSPGTVKSQAAAALRTLQARIGTAPDAEEGKLR